MDPFLAQTCFVVWKHNTLQYFDGFIKINAGYRCKKVVVFFE